MGEEVTYALVKNTLVLAIEQWNHTVQKAREELKDPKLLLKELNDSFDPNVSEAGKEFQEKDLEVVYERLCQSLPEVKVKATDGSLLSLGFANNVGFARQCALFISLYIIYIYIYIYVCVDVCGLCGLGFHRE